MRPFTIKTLALLPCMLLPTVVMSETVGSLDRDSAIVAPVGDGNTRYTNRVEHYHHLWSTLIPKQIVVQNAGNMGTLSAGIGWNYGRRKQWETHFLLGFQRPYKPNPLRLTLTLKENFIPWHRPFKQQQWVFEPLSCGIYLNTILGEDFWNHQPHRYPNNYYWFSTRIRTNIFVGQRLRWRIPHERRRHAKSLTFFYELSTCDFYMIDFVSNKQIKAKDVFGLSLGMLMQIF